MAHIKGLFACLHEQNIDCCMSVRKIKAAEMPKGSCINIKAIINW
jgi:hypothetical protein